MVWAAIGAATIGVVSSSIQGKKNREASDKASQAANAQSAIAQDQWDTYKQTYQPLEKQMVVDAQNYDTSEKRELAAGEAQATTASEFGKARDRLSRAPGLDPSSAAYTASMAGLDMREAAVGATSQNAARNKVKDQAYARKLDALSLGKGLSANASAGLGQVANYQAGAAATQARQSASEAAGLGSLFSNGMNAWNKAGGMEGIFGSSTPAHVDNTQAIGAGDFAPAVIPKFDLTM